MTDESGFFVNTPDPPYFAVVFSFKIGDRDREQYMEKLATLSKMAADLPEFIGEEAVRRDDGYAISVSYWKSEAGIESWRQNSEHLVAKQSGRDTWYDAYELRIAKVDHARSFRRG